MLIHIAISQAVNSEVAWTAGGTSLFKVVKQKLPARSCKKHLISLGNEMAGEIQCG